jgi:hypothetical protein
VNTNSAIDIAIKEYQYQLESCIMSEFISGILLKPVMILLRIKNEKFYSVFGTLKRLQEILFLLIELVEYAPIL